MSQSSYKKQHLVSNIENTEENRSYVKNVNKLAKESESKYRLKIRYRKPIKGDDKTPWHATPWYELRKEYSKLEEENESLKKRIAILENPYMQWHLGDIEDELFEVKERCIDRFLDCVEDEKLRDKYNLLTQAQVIKQGECNE